MDDVSTAEWLIRSIINLVHKTIVSLAPCSYYVYEGVGGETPQSEISIIFSSVWKGWVIADGKPSLSIHFVPVHSPLY